MGLTVLAQNWQVKETTEPIGGERGEQSFLAQENNATNVIMIDGTLPESRRREALLHELIHIVAPDLPEFMVRDLSDPLYAVLQDNDLIARNFLAKVVDGNVTKAEMERLNRLDEKLKQEPGLPMYKAATAMLTPQDIARHL